MKEKLRKCPFCGSDHTDHWTWFSEHRDQPVHPNMAVSIMHYCYPNSDGVHTTISVYGATKEECVKRWNGRGKKHFAE